MIRYVDDASEPVPEPAAAEPWQRWDDDLDRDGLGSLHDVESEAGDEAELADLYEIDRVEARELGVQLDPLDDDFERPLD
jgi:hypothetical protein